jgi:arginine deiminase
LRRVNDEHKEYQRILKEKGLKVITVKDTLLKGTIDKDDPYIVLDSQETKDLRKLARFYVVAETTDNSISLDEQNKYLDSVIEVAHPFDLVNVIFNAPRIILRSTETNTKITGDYVVNPALNLFYTRDQCITTAKGVVIGKMHSPQREKEIHIINFCLNKLGITPIHKISGENAYLEGGDFYPFGDIAFIGCGMRTSIEAITEMLDADVFGVDTLVVVNDKRRWQQQMHLDTYFNIIDNDLCILSEERLTEDTDSNLYLGADIF